MRIKPKAEVFLPVSPYDYEQEQYRHDPWKMLMVCMMLNQTSYRQVDQMKDRFFERFPDAETFLAASDEEIVEAIRMLGLYNRRCRLWKRFCRAWLGEWKNVDELPGIGRYASDSWKIFQEGNVDIEVEDKELKKYVAWARQHRSNSK